MDSLPTPEETAQLPADGGPDYNRLVHETSPYLLQHARNPVDWYPWGEEAFARARELDLPIFLSVGYSTCHWCHVMERESFEQPAVAELLNQGFVPIKVDREERPDLDEIYMMATQVTTGHGGWPNSVWLTADGRPWYAGTYFPPEDHGQRLGFKTLLRRLREAWDRQRDQVEESADNLAKRLRELGEAKTNATSDSSSERVGRNVVTHALAELSAQFDERDGGFGGAPKFPPHGSLRLLLHEMAAGRDTDGQLERMVTITLDRMAQGGIHDHVGGGFHRYSTDAEWLLPHFEKMLYDNAQLGFAYSEAFRLTGQLRFRQTAVRIFDWVLREMTDAQGGFYSALDADSEGEEGKCYVWTPAEVRSALGAEEADVFLRSYSITEEGNYLDEATRQRTGSNIPHLQASLEDVAAREQLSLEQLEALLSTGRDRLLERRKGRIQPFLDDKVLTAWNGLMIGTLARAAESLDESRYVDAARRAADFVLSTMLVDGDLHATYRAGKVRLPAYLDDHAYLAEALLDLYEQTQSETYLTQARELIDQLLARFQNQGDGGFHFTADDHEKLLVRSQDPYDKAIPSGNGVAARVLLRLADGERESTERATAYREAARRTILRFFPQMRAAPRATETLILAASELLDAASASQGPPGGAVPNEAGWADAYAECGAAEARLFLPTLKVVPGDALPFVVALRAAGSGTLAAPATHRSDESPFTEVSSVEGSFFELGEVEYPAPPAEGSAYRGEVEVRGVISISEKASRGATSFELVLRTQVCHDNRCEAPVELRLEVALLVAQSAGDSQSRRHPERFG